MKLAMIEGDEAHAELLRRYVKAWSAQRQIPLVLTSFSGTENFRSMWQGQYDVDALLVDVRMRESEKRELSELARRYCPALAIVFTAGIGKDGRGKAENQEETEDRERERLFQCMDRVLYRDGNRELLTVRIKGSRLELAAEKIMFARAREHGSTIEFCPHRGRTFQVECADSLAALEERLSDRHFVRCHRAYIVRLDKIRHVDRSCIELKNGSRIPVSRGIYSELRQMLRQKGEEEQRQDDGRRRSF